MSSSGSRKQTGPKTARGKANSSRNAQTHGFQKHLAADLLAVSVRPMAGGMHVRVTVGGHLPEAKAVAEELMAELAELDRSVHVNVELGRARR